MKYIDAEKLKAEIRRLEGVDYPCDTLEQSTGFYDALDHIKSFIVSLQQEQPELTWKDLQKLDIIANKLWQDGKYDKNDAQEFYTEVLNEFNKIQEQKNK